METHVFTTATIEHLHRYTFIKPYVRNKVVLDIACGVGYGSNILATTASKVFGVDISDEAISYAKNNYSNDKTTFHKGSTSNIPLESKSIDIIVSFETLEHHSEHNEMMGEVLRVLKNNGILIISSPDKYNYSILPNFNNPFHVKELLKEEFVSLMKEYFKYLYFFSQKTISGSLILLDSQNSDSDFKMFSGDFKEIKSFEFQNIARFNLCIASNEAIEKENIVLNSFFIGDEIINTQLQLQIDNLKKSYSFRLGNFLINPIKKIISFFK